MMDIEGGISTGFLYKAFIIILFSGIAVLPLISVRLKKVVAAATVLLVALLTGFLAVKCLTTSNIEFSISGGSFLGEIPLRIDPLSAWFILIINFTVVTGAIYGGGYLKIQGVQSRVITSHWILYIIFHASMLLVSIIQNGIAFIVAWEIMSLSSFLLVLFDYTNPKVVKAGINYLVQMHISVVLLTVAFIWVYFKTGTFDFKGLNTFFGSNVNRWLFLLFFAGFGIKAGFISFHTWLPMAHPAAPSHISGVMSGVIVKMGIYGILRVIFYLKSDLVLLGEIVLIVSVLTGLFGIMNAAVHRDFKKMLAYCTIENIGIIGIGLGVGLIGWGSGNNMMIFLGFGGALLHVLNHSLFKSLLFFSAGSVYNQSHTRDMDRLGGLLKTMPKTGFLFLIGSIAIGGIPPLNGFVSEFLIYGGILKGINTPEVARIILMIIGFAGLSLIGGISILTFSKTFGTIFLGSPRSDTAKGLKEVKGSMLIPQYFIILVMIAIGLFPGFFAGLAGVVLNQASVLDINDPDIHNYTIALKNISIASLIFVSITALILIVRSIVIKNSEERYDSTWGCGYSSPNVRMQYTGKSFSKSFGKLLGFMLIEKKGYNEIASEETFPHERKYSSFYLDFFEVRIVDPLLHLITRFIDYFQFVQNGKIQAYVLYGIMFITAIFIGTILNFLK